MNAEDMSVERTDGGWTLRFEEVYPTDRTDLWSAISDPVRLARWMTGYELDADGRWRAFSGDEVWGSGRVASCDPPNGFTTSWTAEGEQPTTLAVRLEDAPNGTRLVLVHERITSRYYGAGWAAYLTMLAEHLADPARDDLGDAGFRAHYEPLRPAYEPRFAGA